MSNDVASELAPTKKAVLGDGSGPLAGRTVEVGVPVYNRMFSESVSGDWGPGDTFALAMQLRLPPVVEFVRRVSALDGLADVALTDRDVWFGQLEDGTECCFHVSEVADVVG